MGNRSRVGGEVSGRREEYPRGRGRVVGLIEGDGVAVFSLLLWFWLLCDRGE